MTAVKTASPVHLITFGILSKQLASLVKDGLKTMENGYIKLHPDHVVPVNSEMRAYARTVHLGVKYVRMLLVVVYVIGERFGTIQLRNAIFQDISRLHLILQVVLVLYHLPSVNQTALLVLMLQLALLVFQAVWTHLHVINVLMAGIWLLTVNATNKPAALSVQMGILMSKESVDSATLAVIHVLDRLLINALNVIHLNLIHLYLYLIN
jgi:hypothetical protein